MSDAAAEKPDKASAAPSGGGNKKLLFIVLAVNVLLIGGLAYVIVSGRNQAAAPAQPAHAAKPKGDAEGEGEGEEEAKEGHEAKEEGAEEEEGEGEKKHKTGGKFGPLLDVGTFVANLAPNGPNEQGRYCKVSVTVEAINEDAKTRVEGALVPIRSEALMMLSNAKPDDVIGQEKIMKVCDELVKRVNKLLGKKTIKRVFFSELVVQ